MTVFALELGSLKPSWRIRLVKTGVERVEALPRICNCRTTQQAYYKCVFLVRATDSLSGVRYLLNMLPVIQTEVEKSVV